MHAASQARKKKQHNIMIEWMEKKEDSSASHWLAAFTQDGLEMSSKQIQRIISIATWFLMNVTKSWVWRNLVEYYVSQP